MKYTWYVLVAVGAGLLVYFLSQSGAKRPPILAKEQFNAIEKEAKEAGKEKRETLSRIPAEDFPNLYPAAGSVRSEAKRATNDVRKRLRELAGSQ